MYTAIFAKHICFLSELDEGVQYFELFKQIITEPVTKMTEVVTGTTT